MFESPLPQENPLNTSINPTFHNSELNLEPNRGIFSYSQINVGFSQPKIEISNLTVSSSFSDCLLPLPTSDQLNSAVFLKQSLSKFVQLPNFGQLMQSIFGANFNIEKLNGIISQWLVGDFSNLPKIEVREESVFPTNTLGAFAEATEKIYLSQRLLNSENTVKIGDTILEEIGHWVDKQLNVADTPGDEGQMFAAVVTGQHLNADQIAEIRAEDDSTTIYVDGQLLKVEQSTLVLATITISANDANAGETLTGQIANPGQFTLTRTGSTADALTVNYAVGGTATNGVDYSTLTNSVTFATGASTAIVNINPIDDLVIESDETAIVYLVSSTNYNLGTATTATIVIADNDKPTITIGANDANAGETLTGQIANPGQFTLTRTGSTADALTVNYTVGGTAINGKDYNALTNSVTFATGASTALINITPIDDGEFEGNETAVINLASSTNYNLGTAITATIVIADNDKPTITIGANDASAGETIPGQITNPGQFTLTRTGSTASALTVNYTVGGTAINGKDYNALTNSVTFATGASTALINITPIDDGEFEGNETAVINLASSTNYNLGTAITATIVIADNDKPTITIGANDASAGETIPGQITNPGQFTLTRTGSTASALTVNYTVTGTATNGTDYSTLTNNVTFAAGASTAIINVNPIDDLAIENDETVIINLASSTNYNLGTATTATVVIADNDKPIITISANDANAGETLTGQIANPGQFTLTRTGNTASALTVNYTVGGTATNSLDYSTLYGTATFAAGAATTVVNVIPTDDSAFEGNESVILTLAAGNAYTLGNDKTAIVTLADNDLPTWNVSFINRNDSNYADFNSYDFSRPDATVNLGWQNGFVYESTPFETLTVDSRTNVAPIGQPKVYSSVLEVGKRYRIEASGTWQYWTDNSRNYVADARFQTDNAWNTQYNGGGGLYSNVLSNGNDDIWGEYRPDHVYTYEILGNGQRVDFYVSDSDYLNNQGAYTVKIYRQAATQPTGNTIRLNAAFGERSPAPNVQSDNFAMQAWTTTRLETGKTYQVTTNSDDGTRFFVKNRATGEVTFIGQEWRDRSTGEPTWKMYFNVAKSGDYDFYIQGYDHLGGSAFNVELKETPANSKPNHLGLVTDFNQDGKNDILWRNYSTGENLAWALDGATHIKDLDIEDGTDQAWYVVGTGDFNNDGNVDILTRYHWTENTGHNVVWLMNGNQKIGNIVLDRVDDNNWHIVGTGDFNQDGNVDILWRNYFSGENVIWNMKGTAHDNISLEKQTDLNQHIVGTGDFNGDGKIDILWRNAVTGNNSIWFMDGVKRASIADVQGIPTDVNWHIMGTADFNNDGKSDIILRNYANGWNHAWLMNGNKSIGEVNTPDVLDLNWNIVGKTDPVPLWVAQYFNNKDLSGTPTYTEGFTNVNGNFSRNWGLGAPPNTPADNFSARYKTERYLAPGLYKINLNSDDGVRIWIGNELIINQWTDQAGNYSDYFTSSGGYYPVTIEYKENGGAASLNYEIVKYQPYNNFGNPDGIINSWNATFFHWNGEGTPILDDAHKIGTVNLGSNIRGDGQWGMNSQNWGSGSPALGVPSDFFAMHAYTRASLTAGHTYEVWVRSDDGYQVYAHKLNGGAFNITPNALSGQWQPGAYGNAVKWTFVAPESGVFDFKFNMFEGGGDAYVDLVLKDVTPVTPPPSSAPFTQGEYTAKLYNDGGGTWSRGMSSGHSGIDTYDNDSDRKVSALVGGKVVHVKKGLTLNGVASLYNQGKYNKGYHPTTGQLVTASDYNAEVIIWNEQLNRYFHYYHFADIYVSVGQNVSSGQVIGFEGTTGYSTGTHTHLSVRKDSMWGTLEDPLVILGIARGQRLI
ncbi:Calx-beta domain-containing protein [Tolypothrix sp. VBCCA 56010]|uniref:Calx-beta domain-containing protein n=1 Tax=Tolypothrix sp. VBCCA 56010 TaxID=3137731 RepID=UPI003D7C581B